MGALGRDVEGVWQLGREALKRVPKEVGGPHLGCGQLCDCVCVCVGGNADMGVFDELHAGKRN